MRNWRAEQLETWAKRMLAVADEMGWQVEFDSDEQVTFRDADGQRVRQCEYGDDGDEAAVRY